MMMQTTAPSVTTGNSHVVRYLLGAIRHQSVQRDRAWFPGLAQLTPRSRVLQRSEWYSRQHAVGTLYGALARVTSS